MGHGPDKPLSVTCFVTNRSYTVEWLLFFLKNNMDLRQYSKFGAVRSTSNH